MFSKISKKFIESAIRVNHAGEFGARQIYLGNLAVTRNEETRREFKTMLKQELFHLQYFEDQIKEQNIRPTILLPVWEKLGYFLGVITAALGKETAMLCTEAVEEVIVEHYQEQIDKLDKISGENYQKQARELRDKVRKFKDEELEHKHTAIEEGSKNSILYNSLSSIIRAACRVAISLSKRV